MKKIMFSDKFILTQAVLNGTKTTTRRLLAMPKTCNGKEVYGFNVITNVFGTQYVELVDDDEGLLGGWKPYYGVGEIVAIAQSYKNMYSEMIVDFAKHNYHIPREDAAEKFKKVYESYAGWNNKMFAKAALMKHHIRITDIRVERLQDISDEDCLREGVWQFPGNKFTFYISKIIGKYKAKAFPTARDAYKYLIDKVSGKGTWESNPWVVAYSFELVD